jgi:8-oxo-dGTP diphosphatase
MSQFTSVAIAVVEYQGRFLVGRRSEHLPLGGLWEFPGGKIEHDESPRAAAARECFEETGLRVHVSHCLLFHKQTYPHAEVTLHFLACQLLDPEAVPHSPFQWIARADLAKLQFPEGNRPLLERLLADC